MLSIVCEFIGIIPEFLLIIKRIQFGQYEFNGLLIRKYFKETVRSYEDELIIRRERDDSNIGG
jgi:hypothetical protein